MSQTHLYGTLLALVGITLPTCESSATPYVPAPWPDDIPRETFAPFDCPTQRCLVVQPDTELCSVDDESMKRSRFIFSDKARVTIPEGAFPIGKSGNLKNLPFTVATKHGSQTFASENGFSYEVRPETDKMHEFFVLSDGPVNTSDISLSKVVLATNHIELWPDLHMRMGNPDNMWWWVHGRRVLTIKFETGGGTLLPLADDRDVISFAPCAMSPEWSQHKTYQFEFADGGHIALETHDLHSSALTGKYIGKVSSAVGEYRGRDIDVSDEWNLSFYGAKQGPPGPTRDFAVRVSENQDDEWCGLLFTHDDEENWIAYEMNCDQSWGKPISLTEVPPDD